MKKIILCTLLSLGLIHSFSIGQTINTIAGTGSTGFSGDGGAATGATMNQPTIMAGDEAGNIYFVDSRNARIRKIDRSGIITTIAGNGTSGYSSDGTLATNMSLGDIGGLTVSKSGVIYFTDINYHVVRKIDRYGIIGTKAGKISSYSWSTSDTAVGVATATNLGYISGIAVDDSENVFFVDYTNWGTVIRKVNRLNTISILAGLGTTYGMMNMDSNGNMYVCGYNVILRINSTGNVTSLFNTVYYYRTYLIGGVAYDSYSSGYSGDGGPASNASIYYPSGVAADKYGNIYIADQQNFRVRKIDSFGNVSTIAGNGINWFLGDGGPSTAAELGLTSGITVDGSGNVFISCLNDNRIRELSTGPVGAINGINSVCIGSNTTLTDTTSGGSWSSSNTSIATVGSTGIVLGISHGMVTIRYTTSYGFSPLSFFVDSTPIVSVITGADSVSIGGGTIFTDSIEGGTWVSSYPAIGDFGLLGNFVGVSSGTTLITYSVSNSCGPTARATKSIRVGSGPIAPIGAPARVCIGSNVSLTESTGGGSWSSSQPSIAAIDTSGLLYGSAIGNATISYTAGGSWVTTRITVEPLSTSAALSGTAYQSSYISPGQTMPLYQPWIGGTWTSSDPSVATVSSAGTVTGVSVGNTIISCSFTNSCGIGYATIPFTVGCGGAGTSSIISTFAGYGDAGYHGEGGLATNAALAGPIALDFDRNGNMYFIDDNAYDQHYIRKITPTGVITTIAGKPYRWSAYYSTDDSTGGEGLVASNVGLGFDIYNNLGIAIDNSGSIYYPDNELQSIRKIDSNGIVHTVTGTIAIASSSWTGSYSLSGVSGYSGDGGPATLAQLHNPNAVAIDGSGNLYITDRSNNSIRMVNTSGIISSVIGDGYSGSGGFRGDGGPASSALIYSPRGICSDIAGNIYFCDNGNLRIRKINTSGIISTVAGNGSFGYSGDGGSATDASLNNPVSVKVDKWGNIFIADVGNFVVRKVDTFGIISTLAGTGSAGPSRFAGSATALPLTSPSGLAIDSSGNIYIADGNIVYATSSFGYQIRKVSPFIPAPLGPISGPNAVCAGWQISLRDTLPNGIWSSSNTAIATIGTNGVVSGIATGTATITYTSGCGNQVYKTLSVTPGTPIAPISGSAIITTGSTSLLTDATAGGTWSSTNTAVATIGTNGLLTGVGVGSAMITYLRSGACGTQYATTPCVVSCPGFWGRGNINTIAGTGTGGYSGDGGASTNAKLHYPTGVAVDGAGNLFIADQYNHVIRKVDQLGNVSTVAGTGVHGFSGDGGPASAAMLYTPTAIAFDASGNMYIADGHNYRIRKVDRYGTITTVVGSGLSYMHWAYYTYWTVYVPGYNGGYSGDGGPATNANLAFISGLTFDKSGNMIIADRGNGNLRRVDRTGIISTISGSVSYPGSLAADNNGNIYLSEPENNIVVKIDTGGALSTIAGLGVWSGGSYHAFANPYGDDIMVSWSNDGAYLGDHGPSTAAYLNNPTGISVDGSGNLYISDFVNAAVRKVNTAGIITTVAGSGLIGFDGEGGTATSGKINNAMGLANDAGGNLYIADWANQRIRKVDFAAVAPILGNNTICTGTTTHLFDSTNGGIWSSSNTSVVTVGSSGIVSGISEGIAIISYVTGCGSNIITIYVDATPVAGVITGIDSMNVLGGTRLIDTSVGGRWSSASPAIGTIDYLGNVTGLSLGTAIISYTVTNVCGTVYNTKTVKVGNGPISAIVGARAVCLGSSISLTESTASGSWSSNNLPVATVDSLGNVAGLTPGNAIISYTVGGAWVTNHVEVDPMPSSAALSGTAYLSSYISPGQRMPLYQPWTGGTWVSSDPTKALVNSSGTVSGVSSGNATITCNVTNSCGTGNASIPFTVSCGGSGAPSLISSFAGNGILGYRGEGGLATNAALASPGDLVCDKKGNLYFVDRIPDYGSVGSIRRINASGIISTVAGSIRQWWDYNYDTTGGEGGPSTAYPLTAYNSTLCITADPLGNVYYADDYLQCIRKIDSNGLIHTVAGSFGVTSYTYYDWYTSSYLIGHSFGGFSGYSGDGDPATTARLNNPSAIAFDGSGNLYISDKGNHAIRKVSSSGIMSTITGDGSASFSGDGSTAASAQINSPLGISSDNSGSVYFCDNGNIRVRKINPSGIISTVAGNGSAGYTGDGGSATDASLNNPTSVKVDKWGNIYIADLGNYVVRKVDTSGIITTFAGTGISGLSRFSGVATAIQLANPSSVAIDTSGNVFISDNTVFDYSTGSPSAGNYLIRKVSPFIPAPIGPVAGPGNVCVGWHITLSDTLVNGLWSSSSTAVATIGTSGEVTGIATGSTIITYTSGCGSQAFKTLSVTPGTPIAPIVGSASLTLGAISTFTNATSGGTWSSTNTTVATISPSGILTGVSLGSAMITYMRSGTCGTQYVTMLCVVSCGDFWGRGNINTIAGTGAGGYTGDGGAATNAKLQYPTGVAVDGAGNVFIADQYNHVIRKVDQSGNVSTVVGIGTHGFGGDGGPASTAMLYTPTAIAFDAGGNMYIADANNFRIRKVDRFGIITTVVGSGPSYEHWWFSSSYSYSGYSGGYSGDGGPATNANLSFISGVTFDKVGNIIIADRGNGRLRRVDRSGIITTISGSISSPGSLAADINGNIYLSEPENNIVVKIDTGGAVSTIAGLGASSSGSYHSFANPYGDNGWGFSIDGAYLGDNGPSTAAYLNNPTGISVDGSGNLFISDFTNAVVRKVDIAGIITTVAGSGLIGYTGDGGSATAGKINNAMGLANDAAGNLYIADWANQRIRKVDFAAVGPILGSNSICVGANTRLSDSTRGGVWSSSNTSVATVGSLGIVNGISAGIATISYVTGCGSNTIAIYVDATPVAGIITGIDSMNVLGGSSLSDTFSSGIWSSANPTIGSVDNLGNVTGLSLGTTTISYTINNGCGISSATKVVKVGSGPISAIGGGMTVCSGSVITLTESTSGGSWSSNNLPVATVDAGGNVSGLAPGNAIISYTVGGAWVTNLVEVDPMPGSAALSGTAYQSNYITPGQTMPLYQSWARGTWSTSNASIATVNSSGAVFGVSAGSAIITCNVTNSCGTGYATIPFTVSCGGPGVSGIISTFAGTGDMGYHGEGQQRLAVSLEYPSDVIADGNGNFYYVDFYLTPWSGPSNEYLIRKINSSGIVSTLSGVDNNYFFYGWWGYSRILDSTAGEDSIALRVPVISNTSSICIAVDQGGNVYYPDGNLQCIRKINTSGRINTIAGTRSVYPNGDSTYNVVGNTGYTGDGGPASTATLNNPAAVAIDGSGNIYISDQGNHCIRKINTSGIISTIAGSGSSGFSGDGGMAVSAYLNTPAGLCTDTHGNIYLCDNGNNRIRKVDNSGVISTIAGNGTSGYSGDGGVATAANLNNPTSVKVDVWGNVFVADLGNYVVRKIDTNGIITTLAGNGTSGTARFSGVATSTSLARPSGVAVDTSGNVYIADNAVYDPSTGLYTGNFQIRKVSPFMPVAPISGPGSVCGGSTITLSDTLGGGVWSSGNTLVATVGTNGVVLGIAAGTVTISYTTGCGNSLLHTVTVNAFPYAGVISGPVNLCTSSTITLIDTVNGGVWNSSNTSIATIGSTGIVSGVAIGTAIISYRITNSCGTMATTHTVSVNLIPDAGTITGGASVCMGTGLPLSDSISGGGWSSSNTAIATISTTGIVNGVSAGTTTISYTITDGCGSASAIKIITINPFPSPGTISGSSSVCAGSSVGYSSTVAGGIWSSPSTNVSIAGSTITGVTAGTATISYTVTNGCGSSVATAIITINPLPNAGTISGSSSVCAGSSVGYSSTVPGGVWSSLSANVSISGSTITGVTAGTALISYTVTNGCGSSVATTVITINPLPSAGTISGSSSVCVGSSVGYSSTVPGGVWSSPSTNVFIAGSTITGVTAGTVTISYTVTNSCGSSVATAIIAINPLPNAGTISGSPSICASSSVGYSSTVAGGVWSSISANVSISGSTITGVTAGTATISYTVTNGCGSSVATAIITINPLPSAGTISGSPSVCAGSSVGYSSTVAGGVWSSPSTNVSIAGSTITGVTAGTATISYTVTNGCGSSLATAIITVNPLPNSGTISGSSSVCAGNSVGYSITITGGVWSSLSANVSISGSTIIGVTAGTATISYTVTNGCGISVATAIITVNPLPSAGTISGSSSVCAGSSVGYSSTVAGGVWSSPSTDVSIAGSTITGVTAGTAIISYTVTNGCGSSVATAIITINPLPSAGTISGSSSVCAGSSIGYTSTVAGGVWSSPSTNVSISGSTITGVTAGTAIISYTVTNGCGISVATAIITINPLPNAGTISGSSSVCAGSSVGYSSTIAGGVWSSISSNVSISGSTITGVAAGTATISYTVTNGCGSSVATAIITINPLPNAGTISGSSSVCASSSVGYSSTMAGGVWSSLSANVSISGSTITGVTAGTATISYTVTNGCGSSVATAIITINPLPNAGIISGASSVCAGSSVGYSSSVVGGMWSSPSTNVSIAGSTITGVAAGTATISYTVTNGCGISVATAIITINPLPNAGIISGASSVCAGSSVGYSSSVVGGMWSSPSTNVFLAGSTLTGVTAGTAIISYTVTNGCGISVATAIITVNPLPSAGTISGSSSICAGSSVGYSSTIAGGVWSSLSTIVSISGSTITGVSAGTAIISYTVTNGCGISVATAIITVNPLPNAGFISGFANVNPGSSITLTDAVSGGRWTSSNPAIATVGSGSGIVTGISYGMVVISYSVTNICGTASAIKTITVSAGILPITGTTSLCVGNTTTLTDATTGGTWSSSNTTVATIGLSTGIVSGLTTGTTIITYTSLGAFVTTTVSVISTTPPISGNSSLCAGTATLLYNAAGGGTWSSSTPAKATVDLLSGYVTGLSPGTTIITYAVSCGVATKVITILASPAAITGVNSICQGSTTILADVTAGGTWSSSNTVVATIGSTGLVRGILGGTSTISYTISTGCAATLVETINSLFSSTGITTVCAGYTTVINNPAPGGLWSSSNPAVATVNCNMGIVKGLIPGTATITYTLGSGCISTIRITVISLAKNTGTSGVCVASTTTLSNTSLGGIWRSNDSSIAAVDSSTGVVTGISTGNAIITYAFGPGCSTNTGITVVTLASNTGSPNVCIGSTTTLSNVTVGGTWSSSNTSVAAVVSTTGVITGVSSGTAIITYKFGNTCITTTPINVYSLPATVVVSGGGTYCNNATITASGGGGETIYFQGTTPNGTSTATPSTLQVVTASGTYYFRAQSASGCWGNQGSVTVLIPVIMGPTTVCVGTTTTLGNTGGTGGRWSSSNNAVGSVNATTGVVTGITVGSTTIYDTLPSGCVVSTPVIVGAAPSISGPGIVCGGQTVTLTNSAIGGTWSSSATTIATVGSTGIVTGIASGNRATITYTLGATCKSTISVSVTANNPISVSGSGVVCVGQTTSLTNINSGGTWSSSDGSIATVAAGTGVVTGVSFGTAIISYTLPSGCITTVPINAKILSPITGPASVCVGQTITLVDTTYVGLWTTSAPTVATVGSLSGIVSGIAGNLNATLTYTLGSGCKTTITVSVNLLSPISMVGSTFQVCQGQAITLTNATSGGTWSSSNPSMATFGAPGSLTGVSSGIVTVSYNLPTGCVATSDIVVNPVAPIVGLSTVCLGQTMQLTESAGAGTWSSSLISVATIGTTGIVKGVAANLSTTITYTFCTGCKTTKVVSVNPLSLIGGLTSVCQGLTTLMTDATTGGTWSSSATGVLNFGSTNGNVTGVSAGTATISYSLPTGCTSAMTMTVNPLMPIAGPNGVCYQKTITFTDLVPGGAWSSLAPTIASVVPSTGVVTGATGANSSTTITYTTSRGCKSTKVVSVYALPTAPPAIGGPATVSISGTPITLTNTVIGGTWSSSNSGRATVVSTSGVVTGVGLGTVIITYTVANASGCTNKITKMINVGPLPPPHVMATKTVSINVDAALILNEAVKGGSWSCSDCDGIVKLDTVTGIITGIEQGRANITYTINDDLGVSLYIIKVIVIPIPETIFTLIKGGNVYLIPNPNKGEFTVKGCLATDTDEDVTIEVVNMLGQSVYNGLTKAENGKISTQVVLGNTLANGMYLLNLHSENEHYVFHFVVER